MEAKRTYFICDNCYACDMSQLTEKQNRQRRIDWYNWRKELPRLREEKKQYKLREREFQKELAEKDRIIAEREKRIKELEEENQKLKGAQKKLREIVFKPAEQKEQEDKRGAKNGHRGFFRRKPKPSDITERKKVRLHHCPHCQEELGAPYGFRSRTSIDIPPPQKPSIIEWQMARYHCTGCGHWVQGQPEGLFGKSPFGINLIMKVLDMKYRGRDTDAYIQESLKRWHGIDLSDGGVHAILERAAVLFGLSYEAIKQALCDGKLVQADETGWRVEGENWYAWAFLNSDVTLYQIENTRGSRSERGAEREAINMSCITTLLKQGKDLFREIPILWKLSMASADS